MKSNNRINPLFALVASLVVSVGSALGQATLTAPASAPVESTVLVKYAGDGADNGRITLGTPDGVALVGANPAELSGETTGSVNLVMPSAAGTYSIIYYAGTTTLATREILVTPAGYTPPVVEPQVDVVPLPSEVSPEAVTVTLKAPVAVVSGYAFEVVWAGPADTGDLIALAQSGEAETVISYTYLNPFTPRAILRTGETPAGDYEIQYRNGAGEILATQQIEVQPSPAEFALVNITAEKTAAFGDANAVSVILDASGSMLRDEDGVDRIDTAKNTLLAFMKNTLPAGTPFALRAFGHIEAGSCESELLIPLSPLDYDGMSSIVEGVEAINLAKTPIADSLAKVTSDLGQVIGSQTVILLTDGKETCDGDPAAVIRSLREANANVRVNIIGYAIEEEELRRTFESWAAIGDGLYFDAPENKELAAALDGAVAVPYRIYSDDVLIATGVTGQTSHQIAPGAYTIVYVNGAQQAVRQEVTFTTGAANDIVLP